MIGIGGGREAVARRGWRHEASAACSKAWCPQVDKQGFYRFPVFAVTVTIEIASDRRSMTVEVAFARLTRVRAADARTREALASRKRGAGQTTPPRVMRPRLERRGAFNGHGRMSPCKHYEGHPLDLGIQMWR